MPPQQPLQPDSQKMFIDVTGMKGMAWSAKGDEIDTIQGANPQLRNIGLPGQMVSGVYNPTRRFGYLCPPNNSTETISYSLTTPLAEIRSTYFDPTFQRIFLGENSGLVWINNVGGGDYAHWVQPNVTAFWPLTGTAVKTTSITQYQINGVKNMFITYQETATGGDIAVFPLVSGNTSGIARLSGSATGGTLLGKTNDHALISSDNGFLYILDGNNVHKFDGTALSGGATGTFTAQVLIATTGMVFRHGTDWNGSLWLAIVNAPILNNNVQTSSGSFAGIYVWDRVTTSVTENINFIPIEGVNDIIKVYVTQSGHVRCLCLSSTGETQVREYNGVIFEVISETNGISYPVYRDGVEIVGDMAYWFGADLKLYAHGMIGPGFALGSQYGSTYTEMANGDQQYVIGDFSAIPVSGTGTPGAIAFVDNAAAAGYWRTSFLISINDTGTPATDNVQWFPNGEGSVQSVVLHPGPGNVYTLVTQFPYLSKVNYIRIYHNQTTTSGTTQQGTLSVYFNQSTTPTKAVPILRSDIAQGYKYINFGLGSKNGVISIQFQFQWSTGVTLSSINDWLPRMIEIDWMPLPKKL